MVAVAQEENEIAHHSTNTVSDGGAPSKESPQALLLPLDTVVKLYCVHTKPNFSVPWQMKRPHNSSSSGFIIPGRRVVTNAHCVRHHTLIKVRKRGASKKYFARVLAINMECDLALLTVEDEEFWEGVVSPVEFGVLPSLQEAVTLVGYPVGGATLSVTMGVVSRIVYTPYPGGSSFLAIQIDAAVNSGNSGGPAFNNKAQCVGIAFQKLTKNCDNIGYLIPTSVIAHFIEDYELNGDCTEFPKLGISYQTLENPDLRKGLGMADHLEGVCLLEIEPTSAVAEFLRPLDILLSFDGVNIANDGTVPFLHGDRTNFMYLVTAKHMGDKASFQILRDSIIRSYDIKLQTYKRLVPRNIIGKCPSYYMTGGIVFMSLSEPYLHAEFGADFRHDAPPSWVHKYLHSMAQVEDEEIVIVSQILADEVNIDYEGCAKCQVSSFNSIMVKNLMQLANLVETSKEPFFRFNIVEHHKMIVLDAAKARQATTKIMKTHCIPSLMSEDVQSFLRTQEPKQHENNAPTERAF